MFVSVVTNALDRHKLWRMSAIHQRLQKKLCPRRLIFVLVRAVAQLAHCILWMILFNFLVALPNISHHDAIMNDGYVWLNYFLCHSDTNPHPWVLKIIFSSLMTMTMNLKIVLDFWNVSFWELNYLLKISGD